MCLSQGQQGCRVLKDDFGDSHGGQARQGLLDAGIWGFIFMVTEGFEVGSHVLTMIYYLRL